LYAELGPGERISLAKYASEHHTRTGRRLHIAVDASIWSFQVQSGKGGSNPALRTVYYRLLRLLSHNITPLFVFDGPHRPVFKRGHKINTQLTPALIRLSKKLLKLFGCPFHTAPGEAEAECALLNREGIVDAVLSEDVDTLMFGATTVIRKWSGEGKSTTPTHVTVHDAEAIGAETGLTREGMVLVALMRGGDYLPEGMPGCGIKTAVEAAKAGFGTDLFVMKDDEQGLREWRERLQYELSSNESGWFKRKNGRAVVPASFPNKEILGFYAEPIVSDGEKVERLRDAIEWDATVDVVALREYARDTFEWRGTGGAAKFVRTLAPVLLAQKVWDGDKDTCKLISGLHGRRDHFSTDGCMELRISYTPADVVPINKELEQEDD
ncbi:PIN domain-like protein, partial [Trichophaea hybrida]